MQSKCVNYFKHHCPWKNTVIKGTGELVEVGLVQSFLRRALRSHVPHWQSVLAVDTEVNCKKTKQPVHIDQFSYIRGAGFFSLSTSLAKTSISTKKLSFSGTFITGMFIAYTVQNFT